jgi:hypothetical protein
MFTAMRMYQLKTVDLVEDCILCFVPSLQADNERYADRGSR